MQPKEEVIWIPPVGLIISYGIMTVIEKVQKILTELIPQLFLELVSSKEPEILLKKVNIKLDAALKKSKTLDMSKEIQQALSAEPTIAPENMKTLMRGLLKEELQQKKERRKNNLSEMPCESCEKNHWEEPGLPSLLPASSSMVGNEMQAQRALLPPIQSCPPQYCITAVPNATAGIPESIPVSGATI
jgi:hypothetical protein